MIASPNMMLQQAKRKSRTKLRLVLFRLAAILLGLSPFVIAEIAARAMGLGQPDLHIDPFVGFSAVRPLFQLDATGDRYEIAPSRSFHFFPTSFLAAKPAGEFRVFCIGDSTVQGNPWAPDTSFTKWLELSLQAADPSPQWNIVNCGGISYASYRMVPILEEVLRYHPDLVIVHCSHNEFLEDRTYGDLKRIPHWLWHAGEWVAQLRTYNLLRQAMQSWETAAGWHSRAVQSGQESQPTEKQAGTVQSGRESQPTTLPAEEQALLDYRGGLEFYHHDANWQQGVIAHYEFNLRRMVSLARQAGVPMILMNPACNLRDMPPFKAEHRPGLADEQRQQWESLWAEARSHYAREPQRAVSLLFQALVIDGQHAGMYYDLAKCLDSLGQFDDARFVYLQAKDWDVCPLRILQPMNDIVHEVGIETGTPVVDAVALFERMSRNGIPGDDWFTDHVHPTIPGYLRIADEIADQLVRLEIVHPQPQWLAVKKQRYEEHLASLPPKYFVEAEHRLRALRLWANGRATKER